VCRFVLQVSGAQQLSSYCCTAPACAFGQIAIVHAMAAVLAAIVGT
jgi:hypothetical protein